MEIDDLSVESSHKLKSGGGGVFSRLSSVDGGDERGKEEDGAEEADNSERVLGGLERATDS